ncbi:MAG TPA: hypothetical protein VE641_21285 [Chthoniobacterales bacterium]|nr:hypothetical protein [Chthoniobacterales bacterium]
MKTVIIGSATTFFGGARLPDDRMMATKLWAMIDTNVLLHRKLCRAVGIQYRRG